MGSLTTALWDLFVAAVDLARFRSFLWAWNLLLAFVPAVLAVALFRRGVRRGSLWWLGLVAFILFLPNAPYVLTDVIHLRFDLDRSDTQASTLAALALWGGFMALGMLSYAFSVRRLWLWVTTTWPGRAWWLALVGLQVVVAVGVYLGRVTRLNSWHVVTEPSRVVETASDFASSASWRFVVDMTLLLAVTLPVAWAVVAAISWIGRRLSPRLATLVLRAGGVDAGALAAVPVGASGRS